MLLGLPLVLSAAHIPVLIVDGQNNHPWPAVTAVLKQHLQTTGRFVVAVATSPPAQADLSSFQPDFARYRAVILNYNGDLWGKETRAAFVAYVRHGGGVVVVHAADNAFPQWREFNEIIGLGGWGGRNEQSGPLLRLRDGKFVPLTTPGEAGHHGAPHAYLVETRAPEHPILAGLPAKWLHATDELYDSLRGPAQNLTVIASAYSDPATGGTGEHEPALMVIRYGQGRVFHTILGHGGDAVRCAGFAVTFTRGVEWAATGQVTQPVPPDFPTAEKISLRP